MDIQVLIEMLAKSNCLIFTLETRKHDMQLLVYHYCSTFGHVIHTTMETSLTIGGNNAISHQLSRLVFPLHRV